MSPFHLVHVLDAHDTTTPVSTEVGVLVEARLEGLAEVLEVRHVLRADSGQSDACSSLLVDQLAESSLAADEAEGHTLFSAEGGQVNDELNRVDIVSDNDELGLAIFNKGGDVVETKLDMDWLLGLNRLTF